MKKYKLILMLLVAVPLIFSSCTDEDKDKLGGLLKTAAFPRFVNANPPIAVGVNDVSELVYAFGIQDGNDNMASYDLDMYAIIGGQLTDTVDVDVATSFPADYSFTANDLATLLGLTVADIGFGDSFFFTATATTIDGLVYSGAVRLGFDNQGDEDPSTNTFQGGGVTNDLLDETGYRQAFEFTFIILCPQVDLAAIPGTYDVTNGPFFGVLSTSFEVIAGPGANEFTMIDPYGNLLPGEPADKYNVVVQINTTNSVLTVPGGQLSWDSSHPAIGTPYGPGTFESGTGFVFTCINTISFVFDHQVAAGSFGVASFAAVKQGP